MIRVSLIDAQGKPITPQDLATAAELNEAADKARALARECDRLLQQKNAVKHGKPQGGVPYLS
jgi:hypothetical protein